ncbi:chromosome partition protein [Acrasis kona]|uniref:Chromosome partition protein n=1 Tax=Acrasis kona TaxID=1008807 RepID=A0AAW2Z121_9EUKA
MSQNIFKTSGTFSSLNSSSVFSNTLKKKPNPKISDIIQKNLEHSKKITTSSYKSQNELSSQSYSQSSQNDCFLKNTSSLPDRATQTDTQTQRDFNNLQAHKVLIKERELISRIDAIDASIKSLQDVNTQNSNDIAALKDTITTLSRTIEENSLNQEQVIISLFDNLKQFNASSAKELSHQLTNTFQQTRSFSNATLTSIEDLSSKFNEMDGQIKSSSHQLSSCLYKIQNMETTLKNVSLTVNSLDQESDLNASLSLNPTSLKSFIAEEKLRNQINQTLEKELTSCDDTNDLFSMDTFEDTYTHNQKKRGRSKKTQEEGNKNLVTKSIKKRKRF